jgi:hypothetical protein
MEVFLRGSVGVVLEVMPIYTASGNWCHLYHYINDQASLPP